MTDVQNVLIAAGCVSLLILYLFWVKDNFK